MGDLDNFIDFWMILWMIRVHAAKTKPQYLIAFRALPISFARGSSTTSLTRRDLRLFEIESAAHTHACINTSL